MEELNHELLFDILSSKLPVKSLLRLRCASRALRKMIDDPNFATTHCSRAYSKEPGQILLIDGKSNYYLTILRLLREDGNYLNSLIADFPKHDHFDLHNSCNGLLCFYAAKSDVRGICIDPTSVFVFNPIRKETLMLPPPPRPPPPYPCLMRVSYGLGHDPSKNTYKIVRFSYITECRNVEIHTLGTSSWRTLSEKPPCIVCWKPIFAYGALHWKSFDDNGRRESVLVSFDMAKEVFYDTSHPEFKFFHLVDLGGCLSIVDLSSSTRIEIWMLKDDCGSGKNKERVWVKEYIIEIKAPDGKPDNRDVEVVGMWNNGEILLQSDKMYFSYNPKETDGLRYINIPGLNDKTQVCGYRGSLVSLSRFM